MLAPMHACITQRSVGGGCGWVGWGVGGWVGGGGIVNGNLLFSLDITCVCGSLVASIGI